ncbi:peptidoglycan editing factor PgeF [Thalassotalea aquiviva]|uniref:peptidoglycan editing factor PgeF n=1 Tax=Thalassotalea aquiviva TaxID=3242415 RepID=UPI00352BA580
MKKDIQWPNLANILAFTTTRKDGVSMAPFDSFNLANHVDDEPKDVEQNRQLLRQFLPPGANIQWLSQVHSAKVVKLTAYLPEAPQADAIYTQLAQQPIAILTADCLPILLSSDNGNEIAAIHAGWRPLVANIIDNTLACFEAKPRNINAWLGPCIGPKCFEVGAEVKQQFVELYPVLAQAFTPHNEKYLADLQLIATLLLQRAGIDNISLLAECTVSMPEHYFSYRRDGKTGRMATIISRK